jgi:membrane-associated phospholipid phosphatase
MPIIALFLIALAAGLLIGLAFDRLAPAQGATAAAADALETAAEGVVVRSWWQMRVDPAAATGLALTAALALFIAGGTVVAVLAYLVRGNATLASIDSSAAAWGHDHATHASTRALTWVTDLGDWALFPIGIAILLLELRRVPNRFLVPFALVVVLGDELITNVIKQLADRARPTLNPAAAALGPSFPSGHSSTAAACYAGLALLLARGRSPRVRALLAGGAGGIAIGVAASRVLLDVHWLSDVIAGLMLGWAWFALCAIAFGGRRVHFAEPIEQAESAVEAAPPPPPARTARTDSPPAEV